MHGKFYNLDSTQKTSSNKKIKLAGPWLLFAVLLASSCSSPPEKIHEVADSPVEASFPSSVGKTDWKWEGEKISSGDTPSIRIFPIPGGVTIFNEEGVTALSGKTGDEIWKYKVPGKSFIGSVSDNGEYVALHGENKPNNGNYETPEMVVFDAATGEIVQQHQVDLKDRGEQVLGIMHDRVRPTLRSITDGSWVFPVNDEAVVSHSLGTDDTQWSNSDLLDCDGISSLDEVIALDEVVVAATTCMEVDENASLEEIEEASYTKSQEFTSYLIGIDPGSGKEVWRKESDTGSYPEDSRDRSLRTHESGLIFVDYPISRAGQVVDPESGKVIELTGGPRDANQALWANPEGSRIGVWTPGSRNYRIQDRSNSVKEELGKETPKDSAEIALNLMNTNQPIGLERGVLHVSKELEGGGDTPSLAVFEDFNGKSTQIKSELADGVLMEINEAVPVQGAVAISYTCYRNGESWSGVIGLH